MPLIPDALTFDQVESAQKRGSEERGIGSVKKKRPIISDGPSISAFAEANLILGNVLLSHTVTHAVPSALKGLTSVFGMGTGVSPPPWSPRNSNPREREAQVVSG